MMRLWSGSAFGVSALGGIALLAGCGATGGGTESSQRSAAAPPAHDALVGRREVGGATVGGGGTVPGRSACHSASAKVMAGGARIEFRARCRGLTGGGSVNFVVIRHGGDGRAAILSYPHRPSVEAGSGTFSGHRSCRLKAETIECAIKAAGPILVSGDLGVANDEGCDAIVSIVGITIAPCAEGFCEGGPVLHQLFRGRPRGCPP